MSVVIKIVPSANPEILAHEIKKRFTDAKVGFVGTQGISVTASPEHEIKIAKFAKFPGHVESITENGRETILTNLLNSRPKPALVA